MSNVNADLVIEIQRHLRTFEIFRKLDVEMPIGQIVFFLNAAKMEGATLKEVAEASDAKMTTASRYLANLSAKDRFRQDGLNLLYAYENPENRRQKLITVTAEGIKVLKAISGTENPKGK